MPLVIICGFPSSGKTTICQKLKEYVECEKKKTVLIISEDELVRGSKNDIYSDSLKEKPVRSSLRASVERSISRDQVVILDGLNYIKSVRYELHCIVKAHKTLHCVVYCGTPRDTCLKWNHSRDEDEQYSEKILDALIMRFEAPDSRNRWDSPLFTYLLEESPSMNDIYDSLYGRRAPPPNQSTIPIPLSSGNFLHELDRIAQNILAEILTAQKTAVIGEWITLTDATEKLHLVKVLNMAELRRMKRQFITYSKMHPVEDNAKIGNMFVQFINSNIR